MENETTMGQVVPFARSAEYLRRLAIKQREAGKPLQALELLRLSLDQGRDPATLLEIGETYAHMQCPSLSNQALFPLLSNEEYAAGSLYGAGCNFYAMQMADCARDCLVLSLQKRPDGAFAPEAVDLIDLIDGSADEGSDLELRINGRIGRVLDALDAGKPALAARLIRRALTLENRNSGTHALLAFALLASGDTHGALEAARYAMRCCGQDIRALSAMAATLTAVGADAAAQKFLERAMAGIENDDDVQLICHTACEMGAHDHVRTLLTRAEAEAPFSTDLVHLLALAHHNTGQPEEAIRRWKLLRRIDPMDTIAEYFLKAAEAGTLPQPLPYDHEVPLAETLARLSRLRIWVQEGADAFRARWDESDELEKLLRWGLFSSEPGIPQAMMGVLTTLGDERAAGALLDTLCDPMLPVSLKHGVLAALCVMGVKGPFYALINGRLTLVHVSRTEPDRTDPHLNALVSLVLRRLGAITEAEAMRVRTLCRLAVRSPEAMGSSLRARAVELAFRRQRGETVALSTKPDMRRKLERFAQRLLREETNELHQL